MNVLVVEDIDSKWVNVERVISEAFAMCDIVRASTVVEAIKALKSEDFSLLVLDLVLPRRKDSEPEFRAGADLLNQILDPIDIRPPEHIICLSAVESALAQVESDAQKALVHVIKYDEFEQDWSEAIKTKIQHINNRQSLERDEVSSYGIDVAIITSYPAVELEAINDLQEGPEGQYSREDELYYYHAEWKRKGARPLKIVACSAPSMGMTSACVTTSKVIQRWRPRYVAMAGIAAGTDKSLNYGDIIVADSCYDYGSGKIKDNGDKSRTFEPNHQPITISSELKPILQKWQADQISMEEIGQKWKFDGTFTPSIKLGVLATGAAVIQSESFVEDLKSKERKLIGLEMEAYGVLQACALSSLPKPKGIVAKSICDFADAKKGDDWQKCAAFTSARFVHHFFTRELDLEFPSQ